MDTQERRGLALRTEMFGREAVETRMAAFGEFGKPLQHIINAYAYGDVWQGSALPLATKSLAMIAMMAAAGHANELRVHLKGALKNGCSMEQIQEVLLLVPGQTVEVLQSLLKLLLTIWRQAAKCRIALQRSSLLIYRRSTILV